MPPVSTEPLAGFKVDFIFKHGSDTTTELKATVTYDGTLTSKYAFRNEASTSTAAIKVGQGDIGITGALY